MQPNLIGAYLKGVVAAVAVGLSVGAQAEDTWFVSQTGSNDNTGKSTDDAFLTVGKAVSSAVEGDTIIVAASEEEYPLDEEIKLTAGITIQGSSGNPTDVILRRRIGSTSGNYCYRPFTLDHAKAVVKDVTICGGIIHQSGVHGGGVYITANGGRLEHCIVTDCKADFYNYAGGVYIVKNSSGVIDRCVIRNCMSWSWGGGNGAAVDMSGGTVRNTLMVGNSSSSSSGVPGGILHIADGVVENCTIAGNSATVCAGVVADGGTVRNCLIGANTSTKAASPTEVVFSGKSTCIKNCVADAAINDSCDVEADIFESPLTGDWRAKVGSAAYDGATDEEWMLDALDLDGNARRQGAAADIGAYERDAAAFSASVVSDTAKGLDPLTVTFTVKTLNDAGTVTCKWDWDGNGSVDETTEGTTASHPFGAGDHQVKVTVVSDGTEYAVPGYTGIKVSARTIPVAVGDSIADAVAQAIDGAEIVLATGPHPIAKQITVTKGVTIRSATGDPKDVILRMADKASSRHFVLNNAQATLSGMTLENGSGAGGGAVLVQGYGGTVSNCVFSGNTATGWGSQGGAITLDSAAALVTHCVFTNNMGSTANGLSSGDTQGGAHAVSIAGGTVRNSLFVKNGARTHTSSKGGIVVMSGGTLESCTFAGNSDGYCAGVRAYNAAAVVRNCVFAEYDCPSATSEAMAVIFDSTTASRFDHCCSPVEFGGSWVKRDAPFVDAAHGDWSPAAAIVDKAAPQNWMEGATDLAGNARVSGSAPDIGCYEKNQDEFGAVVEVSALRAIAPYEATFTVTTFGVGDQGVTCSWDWDGDGTWDDASVGTTNHVFGIGSYATKVKVVDNDSGAVFEPAAPFDLLIAPKTICVDCNSENPSAPYQNWNCAAKTLADAYAVAVDGCEIVVATGTYDVSTSLEVKQGVAIRSATGNPKDVILRMADKTSRRHFVLNNALAFLSGMTLENGSGAGGGAILIEAFGGTVSNCVFSGNKSTTWGTQGGAIKLNSADALVTHCVFTNNLGGSADTPNNGDYSGGAHAVSIASGTVRNCLFVGNGDRNRTNCRGGVVVMSGGALENCTFAGNADGYCAGVRACAAAAAVRNCLLAEYDCPSATSAEMAVIYDAATADRFDHCCSPVEFGGSWVKTDDPQFRKPAKGDWRLKDKSPAVNAGVWCDWMDGATDLLGNPRKVLDNPDIGCYECPCSGLMLLVR